jgi:transposase
MRPQPRAPDSGHYEVASDAGGERWATVCSLVATAKLNGLEPFAYLKDVLERMSEGHSMNALHDLLPWNWKARSVKH